MFRAWIGAALLLVTLCCACPHTTIASTTSVYSYTNQNAFTYSVSCTTECPFGANPGGVIMVYIEFDFDTSALTGEFSPTGIATLRDPWGLDLSAMGSITLSHGTVSAWSFSGSGGANHLISAVTTSNLGDKANWTLEYFLPNDKPEYMTAEGSAAPGTWSGPSVFTDDQVPTQLPLPASLLLFATGLGLIALSQCRRCKRQADHAASL